MDNKFLDKVVDQIVSETEIDYVNGSIYFPFILDTSYFGQMSTIKLMMFYTMSKFISPFINHCRDIYGLNDEEIFYVSDKYKKIINDKLKNNGL